MPARRILVLDGHPDADPKRYGHALADAYVDGARGAGHDVRNILRFVGIAPVRRTLIGLIEGKGDARRGAWLGRLKALGARAA